MQFSVVIPVYNRADTLKSALLSVAAQTCQDFEVIVVDDGSEPAEAARISDIVAGFGDPRYRLISHSRNLNGAAARNTGIKAAKGDYVSFLDSDDTWAPEKLASVRQVLEGCAARRPVLVHHPYIDVLNGSHSAPKPARAKRADESVAYYSFVVNNVGGIQSSTITVDRTTAERTLFNERLSGHQDWDFALKVGAEGVDFLFIEKALSLRYLSGDGGLSSGLDWKFSLKFLKGYRSYFDSEAYRFYMKRVVAYKAIESNDLWALLGSASIWQELWFNWRVLPALAQAFQQELRLRRRIRRVYFRCQKGGCKRIAIWGANRYGRRLVQYLPDNIRLICMIDRSFRKGAEFATGVPALTIEQAVLQYGKDIDALILATDVHGAQMRMELARLEATPGLQIFEL